MRLMPKSPKVQPKRTEPYRASVFIPADIYLQAQAQADKEKLSLSGFISRCVQAFLKRKR
jgi:hypothetical protein